MNIKSAAELVGWVKKAASPTPQDIAGNYAQAVITKVSPLYVAFEKDMDDTGILIETQVALVPLGSYLPVVGDRVALLYTGKTWLILGSIGKYYKEEISLSGLVITTGGSGVIITPSLASTVALISGYGSAWSGNTWTAPVEGEYEFTLVAQLGGTTVRVFARIQTLAATVLLEGDQTCPGASVVVTTGGSLYLPQGQGIQLSLFQNTGASQTLDSKARISIKLS